MARYLECMWNIHSEILMTGLGSKRLPVAAVRIQELFLNFLMTEQRRQQP
jgi:hypothetical protein